MKLLIVYAVLGFCGLAYASALKDIQKEWLEYLNKYGKNYRSWDENQKRFENFVNNYKLIKQHNERFEKGFVSYKMAVNAFSDMSIKEMEVSHMGLKITEKYFKYKHLTSSFSYSCNLYILTAINNGFII